MQFSRRLERERQHTQLEADVQWLGSGMVGYNVQIAVDAKHKLIIAQGDEPLSS